MALLISIIANIAMLAFVLWLCADEVFNYPLNIQNALLLSITFIMASYVPSDAESLNLYNMSDNRLYFYVTSMLFIILVRNVIPRNFGRKDKK